MSSKHYYPSTAANTLVARALRALVRANPHLTLDESDRVVANGHHDSSNVSIIGGGGSGHEPAWSGFVGEGLLSAAACGDIFASPSTKQVLTAVRQAPSTKGTILLITNYTGDRLHFGLAAERAKAIGLSQNVAILAATDDVSIGRSKCSNVGRRGMPGHIFTMKVLCAAAAESWPFERCLSLGQAINAQTVTIGSALDHCHIPGRQHQSVPEDVCVVGAGIHNEPGQQMISPFPSVPDLIKRCLALLCDRDDSERAFVAFEDDDRVALLINNYGGLSPLELGALTDEVQIQLAATYRIKPCRTLVGAFETSLNAPGFSISLCNISAAARECEAKVPELLRLLDRPTTAVSWPNLVRPEEPKHTTVDLNKDTSPTLTTEDTAGDERIFMVDPVVLDRAIRSACNRVILAEPRLTEWDMAMGDGDCGEAVKGLAESVLQRLDEGIASEGSLLRFLLSLMTVIDNMGGTLGAIFGILLSAFYSALRSKSEESTNGSGRSSTPFAESLVSAVNSLKTHTPAREGDRTLMDVLLPFADAFAKSGSFEAAVKIAGEKAEATRYLRPRLGRASYVGEASEQQVPDPGAWALYEILLGIASEIQ